MFHRDSHSLDKQNTSKQFTNRPQKLKETNITRKTFGVRTSNLDCAVLKQWALI